MCLGEGGGLCLCVWERNGEGRGQIASGTLERQMGNHLGLGSLAQGAEASSDLIIWS